jgi:hypothetical protein
LTTDLAHTEVDKFYGVALLNEKDVFRLKVPVSDVHVVQVLDRLQALFYDHACILFLKKLDFLQSVEQLAAMAKLHYQVHVFMIKKRFEELHDIRVINRQQNTQLLLKQIHVLLDLRSGDRLYGKLDVWIDNF